MQSFLLSNISQLWILCDVYSMLMWDGRACSQQFKGDNRSSTEHTQLKRTHDFVMTSFNVKI